MAGHQKLTRLIESHHRIDPYITVRQVAEELSVDHSTVVQHLKQIGKVKKLDKWVPHELAKKKNCCFEVSSYSTKQQRAIYSLDYDMQ